MFDNWESCDVQAIALPNTYSQRGLHLCKERMSRIMLNEPNRIQIQPITYTPRSRMTRPIKDNLSDILVDGLVDSDLTICKCKHLIARYGQFTMRVKAHLKTQFHSKACPTSLLETHVNIRIDEPQKKILKVESGPMDLTPNPSLSPNIDHNEPVTTRINVESTALESVNIAQDFLYRKEKLEELLKSEPRLFIFQPLRSIPGYYSTTPSEFHQFVTRDYKTEDLIFCTSCVSILNNYPNDIWNFYTHRAAKSHKENVISGGGICVKNHEYYNGKRNVN